MADDKKPFSARMSAAVLAGLERESRRSGQSNARVAERLLDEGLRMAEFPGIVFRSGPTGRRAGLAGGPDVWEVARDLRNAAGRGADDPIDVVVRATGLERAQVETAAAYHGAYPDEVDERISRNEEMAEHVRRSLTGPATG